MPLAQNQMGLWSAANVDGWAQDLAVPWSAGAALWPLWIVPIVLSAWWIAGGGQVAVSRSVLDDLRRPAAESLLLYSVAPLVWLVLAPLPVLLANLIARENVGDGWSWPLRLAAGVVFLCLFAIGMLGSILRPAQWAARITYGGVFTGLVAASKLVVYWFAVALVCFGLFLWTVGYVWIAIDSLLP